MSAKRAGKAAATRKMGAPGKYSDAMLKAAQKYFRDAYVPTVAELADTLGVCRETVYHWAGSGFHPDIADMLGRIQTRQEARLLWGGLSGVLNPVITKLMLAKHGYASATDNTNKNSGEIAVAVSGAVVVGVAHLSAEEAAKTYFTELRPPE